MSSCSSLSFFCTLPVISETLTLENGLISRILDGFLLLSFAFDSAFAFLYRFDFDHFRDGQKNEKREWDGAKGAGGHVSTATQAADCTSRFCFFFVWVLRIRIMFVTNFHEFPMWINSNSPRYIALPKFQKLTKTLQKPAHQQKQKTTPKISKFLILSSLSYRCCEW